VTIRKVPFALLLVFMVVTEVRLLVITEEHASLGGLLLGLIAALLLGNALASLVWAAAGGEVTCLMVFGVGPAIWHRRSATGRIIRISLLPLAPVAVGYGARPGRAPRAPFLAVVCWWTVIGLAGAVVAVTTTSGFAFGVGIGFALMAGFTLASKRPTAALKAARSATDAARRRRVDPVMRAAGRLDHAKVLELTADLPAVPLDWTDTLLSLARSSALVETNRGREATMVLRGALGATPDMFTPMIRAALVITLLECLLLGEVGPVDEPHVVDEIRRRAADRDTRSRSAYLNCLVKAAPAYLDGDYRGAIRRTLAAARTTPPGTRASNYALASLAASRAGDPADARKYLDLAQQDDPRTPLIRLAADALSQPTHSA
jgi:hypothetical protein